MIILISGGTHSGKTNLAQQLLHTLHFPYLSIDHLKMGLIRSGICPLTPMSSNKKLTKFIWPVVKEIIKTNIENKQNLIIEGCYIPYDFKKDFSDFYLAEIKEICLVFSENYINNHFDDIIKFANIIENRIDNNLSKEILLKTHKENLKRCVENNFNYFLIDEEYIIEKLVKKIIFDT